MTGRFRKVDSEAYVTTLKNSLTHRNPAALLSIGLWTQLHVETEQRGVGAEEAESREEVAFPKIQRGKILE